MRRFASPVLATGLRTGEAIRHESRQVAWAALAISIAWILGWYWETTTSIVSIWSRSPTFTHGFVVVPIVLWLAWRDRQRISATIIRPCLAALIPLSVTGFGWLVAEQGRVLGGTQFMLATLIVFAVWTILGTAMVRTLAFPLAFLYFAVPIGEFLVPPLMDWTADFAIFALRASGIPVFREGIHFSIPNGRWSVVEECSGINYLIASIAVGTVYAYLNFQSLRRRLLFVLLSAVVPLIANGLRAYLIVLIAYLSDNRLAVGMDHLLFGWVLFGGVMMLIFWAGSHWSEVRKSTGDAMELATPRAPATASTKAVLVAALAAIVCASVWNPVSAFFDRPSSIPSPVLAPIAGVNGWAAEKGQLVEWMPEYGNPSASVTQVFSRKDGRVGTTILLYRDLGGDRKLITSSNSLVRSTNPKWRATMSSHRPIVFGDAAISVDTLELRSASQEVLAWHWYWIGGRYTSSDAVGKFYQAMSRIQGRGDDAALVTIYTLESGNGDSAHVLLGDFARDMGSSIERTLREAVR